LSIPFRVLTETDVKAVLSMNDLIDTMASALQRFSTGRVVQPVRPIIAITPDAFFGTMPAFVRGTESTAANFGGASPSSAGDGAAMGAKLVTVFGGNAARGLHTHLATIMLLDPKTGALLALLDGRYITEARTAAVSAVSSRLLARKTAASLAIIGSGVQAKSHLDALSRVHHLRQVAVWSPTKLHRDQFVEEANAAGPDWGRTGVGPQHATSGGQKGVRPPEMAAAGGRMGVRPEIRAVEHAGEAVVGADVIVLVTSSPTPVLESGWVKPGAHVISVGACRPNQREMDPALVARARLFVDSRSAALIESGDIVIGIQEGRFAADHIAGELGELGEAGGRRSDAEITIFKSLGLAVEDVTAADLAYRRAVERGIGRELTL
jgi:alanine dehydrogenase